MQDFNYTVLLSQQQVDEMEKGLRQEVLKQVRSWPGFTSVGRKPYPRRKYKYLAADSDRFVNREVL